MAKHSRNKHFRWNFLKRMKSSSQRYFLFCGRLDVLVRRGVPVLSVITCAHGLLTDWNDRDRLWCGGCVEARPRDHRVREKWQILVCMASRERHRNKMAFIIRRSPIDGARCSKTKLLFSYFEYDLYICTIFFFFNKRINLENFTFHILHSSCLDDGCFFFRQLL